MNRLLRLEVWSCSGVREMALRRRLFISPSVLCRPLPWSCMVVFLHRDMRIFWSWFRVWVLSGVLAPFSTVGDFFVLLSIKELTLVLRVRIRMEAGPALRVVGVISVFHRWWHILGSSIPVASRSKWLQARMFPSFMQVLSQLDRTASSANPISEGYGF